MGYQFNPFTGNLDLTGTGGGGGTPGGSDTQIQFNDAGAFGGDVDLTYNKTTNLLTTKGDVRLDDGGSFTTTIQCVSATANRTISYPDATGTLALVAGSSGQLIFNNAGAYAGVSTLTADGSGNITLSGRLTNTYASIADNPAKRLTGTWFTGGTATTTKPHLLIEPSGATSTAWSTSGTGLGVNAASGFVGNLLDLQVNGTTLTRVFPRDSGSAYLGFFSGGSARGGIGVSTYNGLLIYTGAGTTNGDNAAQFIGSNLHIKGGFAFGIDGLGTVRAYLFSDANNAIDQRNGTNAQTFRVYNTSTSSTNYELGKLEWSSNVFRIGTEKGSGGGTARPLEVHTDSVSRLALDTTGSVRVVTGLTVATLPAAPTAGMIARVTDATAPAVGSNVTGGGGAAALVWYNGANWTVLGV
jgi:hypothetical protein